MLREKEPSSSPVDPAQLLSPLVIFPHAPGRSHLSSSSPHLFIPPPLLALSHGKIHRGARTWPRWQASRARAPYKTSLLPLLGFPSSTLAAASLSLPLFLLLPQTRAPRGEKETVDVRRRPRGRHCSSSSPACSPSPCRIPLPIRAHRWTGSSPRRPRSRGDPRPETPSSSTSSSSPSTPSWTGHRLLRSAPPPSPLLPRRVRLHRQAHGDALLLLMPFSLSYASLGADLREHNSGHHGHAREHPHSAPPRTHATPPMHLRTLLAAHTRTLPCVPSWPATAQPGSVGCSLGWFR